MRQASLHHQHNGSNNAMPTAAAAAAKRKRIPVFLGASKIAHPNSSIVSVLLVVCCYVCLSYSMIPVQASSSNYASRQAIMPLLQVKAFESRRRLQRRHTTVSASASASASGLTITDDNKNKNTRSYRQQQQDDKLCTNVVQRSTSSRAIARAPTANTSPGQRRPTISRRNNSRQQHPSNKETLLFFAKVGLAGGIAGAVGSAALYPMDAAKTLRQSSPQSYTSVFHALACLAYTKAPGATSVRTWHIQNVYRGIIPACLGAIPSSALYFGAYESMKTVMTRYFPPMENNNNNSGNGNSGSSSSSNSQFSNRLLVHAMAAMSGNILSSAIFVPKELIKQQLQFRQSGNVLGVMVEILSEKGLQGLYVGYKATLLRNIPTAVMRFSLYEEFRYRWYTKDQEFQQQRSRSSSRRSSARIISPKLFLAGAAAGMLASGVMTPVDVIKTRMATGQCPVDVRSCFLHVIKETGIKGLYSGAGSRIFFSGVFSAIGFGTFEFAKGLLGVSDPLVAATVVPLPKASTDSTSTTHSR